MNKEEYIKKLDSLNLDKDRYCIISGGVMLLYGLKERFNFKKSPKYPYLYEIDDETEVAVLDYNYSDVRMVDGYPVESLELQLKWMLENNRPKDREKIEIIKEYLNNK